MMEFTLVSTVFNEHRRLGLTIQDIENQTCLPNQIVVVDAGSNDGTYDELLKWAHSSAIDIVILQKPKCNVAEGRNLAIRHSKYDLLVSTDFGCRFHPDWLKSVVTPFDDESVKVVGGAYTVDESSITTLAAKANYIITNGYAVTLDQNFIPSSRSIAYYKSIWESAGGYCEWLTLAADDLVFGKVLKTMGYEIELVHAPYVSWGRHSSIEGYAKESFRYGLGDGEARVNQRSTISNLIELSCRYVLFFGLFLWLLNVTFQVIPSFYFLPLLFFSVGLRSYYRSVKNWIRLRSPKYSLSVLLYSFLVIERTRWNYLKGYFKGFFYSPKEKKEKAKILTAFLR